MVVFNFFEFPILMILIINSFGATKCLSSNSPSESNAAIFNILVDYQELFESLISDDFAGENFSLPVPEMLQKYGYGCQTFNVTTEDGYINTLHRILPRSAEYHLEGGNQSTKVVFLQHGLLGTSADYVMGSPEKSLGYILSDLGYDVWMGNARGNSYSRGHTTYDTDNSKYWEFSWDEMGKYDIPTAVDFILEETKQDKLYYIGHSMGTTMFWVALNEHPNLKDKISLMVGMGPVAKVKYMKSPLRFLSPFVHEVEYLFKLIGINQFAPSNELTQTFVKYVCDENMVELKICENILFLLTGYDNAQSNMTLVPYVLGHEPGGTSTRTVWHYAQEINSGKFCKFDYNSMVQNWIHYRSFSPPEYDLKKVDVPVGLIWSDNDWLADPKDVKYITDNLPHLVMNLRVPFHKFNHVDFLWGKDAYKWIYEPIKKLLKTY